MVADGLLIENSYFYVVLKVDVRPLAELFRASVLKMLKDEGRFDEAIINKILTSRYNSGPVSITRYVCRRLTPAQVKEVPLGNFNHLRTIAN